MTNSENLQPAIAHSAGRHESNLAEHPTSRSIADSMGRASSTAVLAVVLASASALTGVSASAQQGPYPNKVVKVIAPYAPGGTVDALARAFAQAFTAEAGVTFLVDNRAGAGGNIGMAALSKAPPDGYTLGISAANMLATNQWLYKSLPFDATKDFAPVAFIGRVPLILVINSSVPAKNLAELTALMKSKTMQFNFGSSGVGNTAHLLGELFKSKVGVEMVHVPYKSSGEALQELLAGRLQFAFTTPTELLPLLAGNGVRPIAVAGPQRLAAVPNVPTLKELGVDGFEAPTWFGIVAPAGTPAAIVNFMSAQTKLAMLRPAVKLRLEQVGVTPQDMTPTQFGEFIAQESVRWRQIVKQSGAKLE